MSDLWRVILRGAPGHPGTPILCAIVALGALAGLARDPWWIGALSGAGIMFACFGPVWLVGAVARGRVNHD